MDTSRIALLIGTIGAGLMLVLLLVPNALLSMLRPVPEAPTPAPTEVVEVPTEAPTTTPVPLPTPAPAPTDVPTTEPATAEPEQADRDAAPEDAELARLQNEILTAYNCAQETNGLPPFELDPELTAVAQQVGEQLGADSTLDISDIAGEYLLHASLALEDGEAAQGCSIGGFDLTEFPPMDDISRLGIAVFPGVEYVGPSAIIIGT